MANHGEPVLCIVCGFPSAIFYSDESIKGIDPTLKLRLAKTMVKTKDEQWVHDDPCAAVYKMDGGALRNDP